MKNCWKKRLGSILGIVAATFLLECWETSSSSIQKNVWGQSQENRETETWNPASVSLVDDWSIRVDWNGHQEDFSIDLPDYFSPQDEKYDSLPVFNPNGSPWRKALPLQGVNAQECCVFYALVPGSVQVRLEPGAPTLLVEGTDYQLDEASGNIGRLENGAIHEDTPVYISYQYAQMRIDSIVCLPDGSWQKICGEPHAVNPEPPALLPGQKRLANIWISGRIERLTPSLLFPILPSSLISQDESPADGALPIAAQLCPKTWQKLTQGQHVRILAWGDSVTECGFLPDSDRWQQQFVDRLQQKFPKAQIELISRGWGGRTTAAFLNEPAGSPHNYQEQVLDVKPDLIVSEFVNDAYMDQNAVDLQYGRIRDDFNAIGVEWIICSPHYVRPDWMGLSQEIQCDNDPRPYVAAIREFAKKNQIALADTSLLYGQLWRQGIPFSTLMVNNINHPNRLGMSLFADALMKLF